MRGFIEWFKYLITFIKEILSYFYIFLFIKILYLKACTVFNYSLMYVFEAFK